jgi:hypothetical protein
MLSIKKIINEYLIAKPAKETLAGENHRLEKENIKLKKIIEDFILEKTANRIIRRDAAIKHYERYQENQRLEADNKRLNNMLDKRTIEYNKLAIQHIKLKREHEKLMEKNA